MGNEERLLRHDSIMVLGKTYEGLELVIKHTSSGVMYSELRTSEGLLTGGDIHYGSDVLGYLGKAGGLTHHDKSGNWDGLSLPREWVMKGYWGFKESQTTILEKTRIVDDKVHKMYYQIAMGEGVDSHVRGQYSFDYGGEDEAVVWFDTNCRFFDEPINYQTLHLMFRFQGIEISLYYPKDEFGLAMVVTNKINHLVHGQDIERLAEGPDVLVPALRQPFDITRLWAFSKHDALAGMTFHRDQVFAMTQLLELIENRFGTSFKIMMKIDPHKIPGELVANIDADEPKDPLHCIGFWGDK